MSTGPRPARLPIAGQRRTHRAVGGLLAAVDRHRPVRMPELLLTLYADVITMHGGCIWLGSLVRSLAPLGFSESLVRVSLYRLAAAGRLIACRHGRRSYYEPSRETAAALEREEQRLYAEERAPDWDGRWTLVLAPADGKPWTGRGYVRLARHLYAHPFPDPYLHESLSRGPGGAAGIVWDAECLPACMGELRRRLWRAWKIDALEKDYRNLLSCARRVARAVAGRPPAPAACFQLRILLIHEYRSIRLRDPGLPHGLLPAKWPGTAVHRLLPDLYQTLSWGSLDYIRASLETVEGRLPVPDQSYFRRFGGLSPRSRQTAPERGAALIRSGPAARPARPP